MTQSDKSKMKWCFNHCKPNLSDYKYDNRTVKRSTSITFAFLGMWIR